jgi:hypothetical protein
MLLGLARNVAVPSPILAAKFNTGDRPHAADDAATPSGTAPLVPGFKPDGDRNAMPRELN